VGVRVGNGNASEEMFCQECLSRQIEPVADGATRDQGIFGANVLVGLRSVVPENVEDAAIEAKAPVTVIELDPRFVTPEQTALLARHCTIFAFSPE